MKLRELLAYFDTEHAEKSLTDVIVKGKDFFGNEWVCEYTGLEGVIKAITEYGNREVERYDFDYTEKFIRIPHKKTLIISI